MGHSYGLLWELLWAAMVHGGWLWSAMGHHCGLLWPAMGAKGYYGPQWAAMAQYGSLPWALWAAMGL